MRIDTFLVYSICKTKDYNNIGDYFIDWKGKNEDI